MPDEKYNLWCSARINFRSFTVLNLCQRLSQGRQHYTPRMFGDNAYITIPGWSTSDMENGAVIQKVLAFLELQKFLGNICSFEQLYYRKKVWVPLLKNEKNKTKTKIPYLDRRS